LNLPKDLDTTTKKVSKMESRRRKLLAYSLICFSYLIILHEINAVPTLKASKSIQEELELNPKYKIAWRIDEGSDKIEFDLIVQSTGYVGFGLSPTGGMDGADMIIAGVLDNGTVYFSVRIQFIGISNENPHFKVFNSIPNLMTHCRIVTESVKM